MKLNLNRQDGGGRIREGDRDIKVDEKEEEQRGKETIADDKTRSGKRKFKNVTS